MLISNIQVKKRFRKDLGDLTSLKDSIKELGLLQPIVVDENGVLIAGERRLKACKELGIEEIDVKVANLEDNEIGEIEENTLRENFTEEEIILIGIALEKKEKEKAEIRMKTGKKLDPVAELPQGKTRDVVAEKLGISGKTYEKGKKILESQDANAIEIMNNKSIDAGFKKIKQKQRTEELETQELPKGKYNIIYADPNWKYWESGDKNQSQHYETSSMEDIENLPVADLADKDCILFMWATWVILPEALKLIEKWGFKYSTAGFVWAKSKQDGTGFAFGCGSWTRANTEFCLIATKGSIPRKDASISQIIYEPKREHSRKPDIVRDRIVQLVGDLPRIELFARTKPEGWAVWGAETNKFKDAE